ncbi:MAG: sulfatase-like hydrolase/transferase [Planctomycetota bacterium]
MYILLDDVGYGEIGCPDLTPSRGYSTPNIDALARQGLTLGRMYSEPSCTPTRVAMMTGRLPVRTGMTDAKATIAGLNDTTKIRARGIINRVLGPDITASQLVAAARVLGTQLHNPLVVI